jgi:ABC-2 type transport system permease protein
MNSNKPVMGILIPSYALLSREVIRFVRQKSRLFGALGQPLIFWLLLGAGLGGMFQLPESYTELSYLEYLYPGIIGLIVLFTAIFSTISVIEDRNAGFLQGVLAAPVPRSGIVLGKIMGGVVMALLQASLMLLAIPFLDVSVSALRFIQLFLGIIVIAFALTSLGYIIAWPMESTQGFHSIMNVLLIPMWLLSGAFFPAEGLPFWLSWIMVINPLTYGMNLIHGLLYGAEHNLILSWLVTLIFAGFTFSIALLMTHSREKGKKRKQ